MRNAAKRLVMFLLIVLLAACTRQDVKPAADMIPQAKLDEMADNYNANVENEHDQVICSKEKAAGSRFIEVQCRTKGSVALEQEAARRYLYKQQTNRQK